MEKYTQRRLRELIEQDHALDITHVREKIDNVTKVGYSSGIYGCNGLLLEHNETKQLYAITSRSTSLFLY